MNYQRGFYARGRGIRISSSKFSTTAKRKYAEGPNEVKTSYKRPNLRQSGYEPVETGPGDELDKNCTSNVQLKSVDNNMTSLSREQQKRYSANSRLELIRKSFSPENKSSANYLYSPTKPLIGNSNVQPYKPNQVNNSNDRQTSFVVTAKPSTLQNRISKIRNYNEGNRRSFDFNTNPYINSSPENRKDLGGWLRPLDVEGRGNNFRKYKTELRQDDRFNHLTNRDDRQHTLQPFKNREQPIKTANSSTDDKLRHLQTHTNTQELDVGIAAPINFLMNLQATTSNFRDSSQSCPDKYNNDINSCNDEQMDWSYFDEKEVMNDLQELRKTEIISAVPKTPFQKSVATETEQMVCNKTIFMVNYIVVDTNIFLSHLDIVRKVMKIKINGVVYPTIFVPWIVIQELDHIKDGRSRESLKRKAQQAIHFINDCLSNKKNLKGQSVRDAAQQDFASSCFDDGILYSCLQIRDKQNRAILLSNDVNLRNKVMNEKFEAFNHEQIIKRLDPHGLLLDKAVTSGSESEVVEDDSMVALQAHVSHLFSYILFKELKNGYGDLYKKMGSTPKNPPWPVIECLGMFEKHWMPIFQIKLPKQTLRIINQFHSYLKSQRGRPLDMDKYINYTLELCLFLRTGLGCFFNSIQECIKSVESMYETIK